jgi:Leucine-rich repeat (LRR) protein
LNAVWFDSMPELTGLILSDNPGITRYPESGFFTKNPKLNKVELENNKITDLLEVLTWLQNVKSQLLSLILSGNLIQKIPSEINAFTNLIELNLRANKISQITAATFNGLTELITLDVRDNIMSAPIYTFKSNKKLSYTFFDGNLFNKIHDFYASQNSFISYLSYGNQNGI